MYNSESIKIIPLSEFCTNDFSFIRDQMPIHEYLLKSIAHTEAKLILAIKNRMADVACANKNPRKTKQGSTNRSADIKQDDSHLRCEENWMGLNYISDTSDDNYSYESDTSSAGDNCKEIDYDSDHVSESSSGADNTDPHLHKNLLPIEKEKSVSKKRGKLLEPCPQFFLLQQMPKGRNKKRAIIKNANCSNPVKVGSIPVRLLTTSFFDSLVEILVSSYYSNSEFQKFMHGPAMKNVVLKEITEYATELKLKNFYRKRAEISSTILTDTISGKLY